jgi:hypothetical protein
MGKSLISPLHGCESTVALLSSDASLAIIPRVLYFKSSSRTRIPSHLWFISVEQNDRVALILDDGAGNVIDQRVLEHDICSGVTIICRSKSVMMLKRYGLSRLPWWRLTNLVEMCIGLYMMSD